MDVEALARKAKRQKQLSRWTPFLYLLPAFIIVFVFRFLPILYSFYVSFFEWGIVGATRFAGLENYILLLQDKYFWSSILYTFYFVLGVVPFGLFISLTIATLLTKKIKGLGFYRTMYFLPVVTSMVAVSMVWKWIYLPDKGLAQYFLDVISGPHLNFLEEPTGIFKLMFPALPNWMEGPSLSLVCIVIMSIWKSLGYNIVIFIAGLQNIPKQLYEAAKIDGANGWQTFWNVTWPMLTPTTFYVLMMSTITSFQAFTQIYMMTEGGPLRKTQIIVHYLYDKGFFEFERGYASAIALILFLVILGFTIFQKRVLEKRVHYS